MSKNVLFEKSIIDYDNKCFLIMIESNTFGHTFSFIQNPNEWARKQSTGLQYSVVEFFQVQLLCVCVF